MRPRDFETSLSTPQRPRDAPLGPSRCSGSDVYPPPLPFLLFLCPALPLCIPPPHPPQPAHLGSGVLPASTHAAATTGRAVAPRTGPATAPLVGLDSSVRSVSPASQPLPVMCCSLLVTLQIALVCRGREEAGPRTSHTSGISQSPERSRLQGIPAINKSRPLDHGEEIPGLHSKEARACPLLLRP